MSIDENDLVTTYGAPRPVPGQALRTLLALSAVGVGAQVTEDLRRRSPTLRTVHLGDSAGRVLGWLWSAGLHDEATLWLTDVLSHLRVHVENPIRPAVRLEDVLTGLRLALPNTFPDHEVAALVDRARVDVPAYYGSDPNADID